MTESPGWSSPDATPGAGAPGPAAPPQGYPPPGSPGPPQPGPRQPGPPQPSAAPGHPGPDGQAYLPPGWGVPPAQPPGPPPAAGWAPAQPPSAPAWTGAPPQQQWSGWVAQRPPEVKPGVVPLRPLGVGEILDGAIATMRRHWKIQLGLSAAVVTVTSILQFGVLWVLFDSGVATVRDTGLSADTSENISGAANAASVITGLVGLLAQLVLTGFLSIVVSRAVLGQDVTIAEAWASARGRRWRLVGMSAAILLLMIALVALPIGLGVGTGAATDSVGTGIAAGVVTGLGCLVLAVWLYVSIGVAAPAMMLEQSTMRTAFARSRRLVRGSWWRVFGILLLGYVIAQVLSSIIAVPFVFTSVFTSDLDSAPGFSFYLLNVIGSSLGGAISYPFAAGVVALVYVDLRMRREGLDLALARAAGVGQPAAAPGPTPPSWYGTR